MKKREYYLQDDQSNKYWTVAVDAGSLVTTNGRIGARPRETRTDFGAPEVALAEAEKAILAKRRKGYVEGNLSALPEHSPRLPPRFVRINHDDYHARYVGRSADGDQFFLTFPFVPRLASEPGASFVALYRFDEFGQLKSAEIHNENAEGLTTDSAVQELVQQLLSTLGKYKLADIKVAPFSIDYTGRKFGLIFDPGEEDDDEEEPYTCVTVEPGNYMAFSSPWDGDYDT